MKLLLKGTTNTPISCLWERISDIHNYPKWVKFCKKVRGGTIEKGAYWEDVTILLWFPITVKHVITSFKKEEEISYFMKFPFNGYMHQKYSLRSFPAGTELKAEIIFDLGNRITNLVIGNILKKRLAYMLTNVFPQITLVTYT